MNEFKITNINGVETVDSRQVAEAVGKEHKELLKNIRKYCEYLGESKISLTDFFIESTYITEQNKSLPCFLCTRKGCEMDSKQNHGAEGGCIHSDVCKCISRHGRKGQPDPESLWQEVNVSGRGCFTDQDAEKRYERPEVRP